MTAMFRTMTRAMLCSICVLALALGPSMADDDDEIEKVECGDDDESIQEALDDADAGDTIRVSGTCNESIVIDKDRITLDCKSHANASIIGTGGRGSTISVHANNVTVTNCDVSVGDSTIATLSVVRSGSMVAENNLVTGSPTRNCLGAAQGSYGRFIGNVTNNCRTGVTISGNAMADLFQNTLNVTRTGVFIGNASAGDIVDNTITGPEPAGGPSTTGVFVSRTATANFSNDVFFGNADNTIQAFDFGIRCFDNSAVRIGSFNNARPQDPGTGNGTNTLFEGGSAGCAVDIFGGMAFQPPLGD